MYKSIELDYNFKDLENFLDEETLTIHFDILYKNYLNRLNKVLEQNHYDFGYSKEELIEHIEEFPIKDRDTILYNLGGVLNHERYFTILDPHSSLKKTPFLKKIEETYGSFSNFKEEFLKVASYLVGSGYTNLVLDKDGKMLIINTSNQELPDFYGFYPLISLDLWEHAYFLKYHQKKEEYMQNFFNYLNYDEINALYEEKTKEIQSL